MKWIEISSRKFWFFHYKMDAAPGELLENVEIKIFGDKRGGRSRMII